VLIQLRSVHIYESTLTRVNCRQQSATVESRRQLCSHLWRDTTAVSRWRRRCELARWQWPACTLCLKKRPTLCCSYLWRIFTNFQNFLLACFLDNWQ